MIKKPKIKRLVLDVLIPRELHVIDLSKSLASIDGVNEVKITVTEVDERTETIKIEIIGDNINYDSLVKILSDIGAALRSVDELSVTSS